MKTAFVLSLALLFVCAGTAVADLTPVGSPVIIGSWSQAFNTIANPSMFDNIKIDMLSGSLEAPGLNGFSNGTWLATFVGPTEVTAAGDLTNFIQFNVDFGGLSTDPLSFNFYAYQGNALAEFATAYWDGAGWTINPDTYYNVPEPASLVLFGSGLMGAGSLVRKRRFFGRS